MQIPWNYGKGKSAEEKFWKNIRKTDTCWIWIANKVDIGYGNLTIWNKGKSKGLRAHRVSWEIHFGKIPKDMNVLHKCDNPSCVNPNHLWLGTQADNMLDKVLKGRQAKGLSHGSKTKPENISKGKKHGMCKLSIKEIQEIRNTDISFWGAKTALAQKYKISKTHIGRIISHKSWNFII